jgi:tRNA(His) 5'-end guanylyltransferase
MLFDNNEGRNKMEDGGWNLSRFCSISDYNIIGAMNKTALKLLDEIQNARVAYVQSDEISILLIDYKNDLY